ncbi:acyl-CoA dehydrogenase family protein, partial [Mycobacterium sp. E3298]|uniref:acyl-CoA dehydrogenase family protein n=1 Tax=Mycobacterium sp. E3298 TaxID=1856865 RepID=UPI000ADE2837
MNVEEFRAGLRSWLDDNDLTPGPDHSLQGHMRQFARVSRALYDADWMRYGWPAEVGGLGGPAVLRAIVGEEVVGRRLAEPGPYSMLEVLAPTMIDYAPPELAAEMVPRLLSGEEQWCQGFSEPGSGSDLASLTTRATQQGDNWIVNGQKVWTSGAHDADVLLTFVRTDP